jgi:molecular chaperone DnaK (HSP70)
MSVSDNFLQRVLRDAKIDKSSVHDIVLVGGSTRIPKIQKVGHIYDFEMRVELD